MGNMILIDIVFFGIQAFNLLMIFMIKLKSKKLMDLIPFLEPNDHEFLKLISGYPWAGIQLAYWMILIVDWYLQVANVYILFTLIMLVVNIKVSVIVAKGLRK